MEPCSVKVMDDVGSRSSVETASSVSVLARLISSSKILQKVSPSKITKGELHTSLQISVLEQVVLLQNQTQICPSW
jgi:hypothetical protein